MWTFPSCPLAPQNVLNRRGESIVESWGLDEFRPFTITAGQRRMNDAEVSRHQGLQLKILKLLKKRALLNFMDMNGEKKS